MRCNRVFLLTSLVAWAAVATTLALAQRPSPAGGSPPATAPSGAATAPAAEQAATDYHLFLLIGQSNMAGRGAVADEDRQPHPRVLVLDKNEKWQPAVDPLHFDKPQVVGVGPGRSFGVAYAEAHPDATVGLIPCAVGGSPIAAWQPGAYYQATHSHPYDHAMARAKVALRSGSLRGILWHQGESDASPDLSAAYADKLAELIARLRDELMAPEVPFLIGQLGQFAERPWDEHRRRVDQAHRELAQRLPLVAFVSSQGLTHRGDEVHFDSPSARQFGQRYFEAWQQCQRAEPPPP